MHRTCQFSAPALLSHIATEDETFDTVLALAGESLDDLFESRDYLKPAADFPRQSCGRIAEVYCASAH